jgi:hypothetical protein
MPTSGPTSMPSLLDTLAESFFDPYMTAITAAMISGPLPLMNVAARDEIHR